MPAHTFSRSARSRVRNAYRPASRSNASVPACTSGMKRSPYDERRVADVHGADACFDDRWVLPVERRDVASAGSRCLRAADPRVRRVLASLSNGVFTAAARLPSASVTSTGTFDSAICSREIEQRRRRIRMPDPRVPRTRAHTCVPSARPHGAARRQRAACRRCTTRGAARLQRRRR